MTQPILKFYFQPPFNGWVVTTIYQALYNHYKTIYGDKIIFDHTSINYNNEYGFRSGPHHLIIENIQTGYYKVITYWDNASTLANDYVGWDNKKCLGIYSSVEANLSTSLIPTSYCCYNAVHENTIRNINIIFDNKKENSLSFRGYLYSQRFIVSEFLKTELSRHNIKFYQNLLSYEDYIKELNNHKIGLSFNGAAEICHRDIEILGVGSVLLRPKLKSTKFYNPLISDFHYVSYDTADDPKEQLEIISEKQQILLKDEEYMRYVAFNGCEWYNTNGSTQANVNILSQLLKLEELL